jgi:hypothetical protein
MARKLADGSVPENQLTAATKNALWVGVWLLAGSALSARANTMEYLFAPVGGPEVTGGQLVDIEVFLVNLGGVDQMTRGIQIDVPCLLDPVGGATGTITTGSGDGDPLTSLMINATSAGGFPRVFPGGLAPINQMQCRAAQTAAPGAQPVVTIPAGATRYVATLRYRVSICATGQHQIDFECDAAGTQCNGKATTTGSSTRIIDAPGTGVIGFTYEVVLFDVDSCDDGDLCTVYDECSMGTCEGTYQASFYGDLVIQPGDDGIPDVTDLICALDGFRLASACPQADIAPCGGDGTRDVGDVLVILDLFAYSK